MRTICITWWTYWGHVAIWASSPIILTTTNLGLKDNLIASCMAQDRPRMVTSSSQIGLTSSACMDRTTWEYWRPTCLAHALTSMTMVWNLNKSRSCLRTSYPGSVSYRPSNTTLTSSQRNHDPSGSPSMIWARSNKSCHIASRTCSQSSTQLADATLWTSLVAFRKHQHVISSCREHLKRARRRLMTSSSLAMANARPTISILTLERHSLAW